jgi:hypothetical protein
VLGSMLALNRTYQPYPLAKWQQQLLAGFDLAPDALAQVIRQSQSVKLSQQPGSWRCQPDLAPA